MGLILDNYNQKSWSQKSFKIPVGTKKPIFSYYTPRGKLYVPEEDIVYIHIDPKDQFSLAIIAGTGYGKSRLFKRMLHFYIEKAKMKTLIFDCKGFEMYFAKFKTKQYQYILPWEKPKAINMKCYMPSFARKKAEENKIFFGNEYLKTFGTFAYQFEDISDDLQASTLGISPRARMAFLDIIKPWLLKSNIQEGQEILDKIKHIKIPYSSKENLIQIFQYLTRENLFSRNYPKINIEQDWKNEKVVNISLLEPEESQASFYAGKIISDLYSKNIFPKQNKLLVIDDANKLVGKGMKMSEYLSVKKVIDVLTLGRYKNWNIQIMSQSFNILNEELFPHIKYKIVGKLGSKDINYLSNFCSPNIIHRVKTLNYDPPNKVMEMLIINPDNMTCQSFYALGPLCKHP